MQANGSLMNTYIREAWCERVFLWITLQKHLGRTAFVDVHQENLFVALESQGRCPGMPLGTNIWVYEMSWHSSAQAMPLWMKQWDIPVSFRKATSMVADCPKCYQEKKNVQKWHWENSAGSRPSMTNYIEHCSCLLGSFIGSFLE